MSTPRQWLDHGLQALPPEQAQRVRLFRLLLGSASMLRNRLDREMAPSGITTQQAGMLQFIEAQPEAPTMGTVAAGLSMTHQNVKQIALVLQRKGFVEIEVDETDRRARRLRLTAHHRRFWARRNPGDAAHLQAWTAALDDAEVAELVRLLGRLVGNLGAAQGDGPLPDNSAP